MSMLSHRSSYAKKTTYFARGLLVVLFLFGDLLRVGRPADGSPTLQDCAS